MRVYTNEEEVRFLLVGIMTQAVCNPSWGGRTSQLMDGLRRLGWIEPPEAPSVPVCVATVTATPAT